MNSRNHRSMLLTSSVAPLLGLVLALPVAANEDTPCPAGKFPASGQTTAYQADKNDGTSGNFVDVPDDGTVEAGATLRYKDKGDGTIKDRNTKLTWEKKSDDDGLHDQDNTYAWSGNATRTQETIWDWLEDINTEGGTGFAGHSDWRMPNVKELQSIIDYERSGPAVKPVFNKNCTPGVDVLSGSCTAESNYWSSTTAAGNASLTAWVVRFGSGLVGFGSKEQSFLRVRAVRGGCQ